MLFLPNLYTPACSAVHPTPVNLMNHFRGWHRDRASVRHFLEGKASVYALIAKDQLMSFQDLAFSACSARERDEVEASARSQREAAEARAAATATAAAVQTGEQRRRVRGSSAAANEDSGGNAVVAAASNLADAQMDGQWRAVSLFLVTDGCVRPAAPRCC